MSFPVYFPPVKVRKDVDINVKVRVDIAKQALSKVAIIGQLADAEAQATTYGYDGLAETYTATDVNPMSTAAYSSSISATNGAYAYIW